MLVAKPGMIKRTEESDYHKFNDCGWKIHLAVNPLNYQKVFEWLVKNCRYSCKFLSADINAGKDFTIYVGSWKDTKAFAELITFEIGPILEHSKSDAAVTDLEITPKTCARFVPPKSDKNMSQNGLYGIPFLKDDATLQVFSPEAFDLDSTINKAYEYLARIYKVYFTGNNNEVYLLVQKRLEMRDWWKPKR